MARRRWRRCDRLEVLAAFMHWTVQETKAVVQTWPDARLRTVKGAMYIELLRTDECSCGRPSGSATIMTTRTSTA
jgi:hypothetical protein